MKKLTAKLWQLILVACLFSSLATPAYGASTPINCSATNSTFDFSQLTNGSDILLPPFLRQAQQAQNASLSDVCDGINYYTSLLLAVVGIAAFLYLLYGGFLYITAFGEDAKLGQAKKVITEAVIGLVIAALAFGLVALITNILSVKPGS